MRINFVEKFDLYEKLDELVLSLQEHEESQAIVKSTLHDLKSNYTNNRLNRFVSELKNYNWITPVEDFINELDTFITDNKYGIRLEQINEKVKHSDVYVQLSEKIQSLIILDESEIVSKLHELSKFKYEPNVRNILEVYRNENFGEIKKDDLNILRGSVSPVMKVDEGFVVNVTGKDYLVNSKLSEIKEYNGTLDNIYKFSKNVLGMFEYLGEGKFEYTTPNGKINVEVLDNVTKMYINESQIVDKKSLNNVFKVSNIVPYTDSAKKSAIEFMYENAHTFIELDFVKHIKTNEGVLDIFSLSENIYLTKFDFSKRARVLEKMNIDSLNELQEGLKKKYNIDFDLVLESISARKEVLEFEKLVESINLIDLADMSKYKEVYENISKAVALYNSLENKKGLENSYKILESKKKRANLDKVLFLVETKKALLDKLNEGKELEESLGVLSKEIKSLVSEK